MIDHDENLIKLLDRARSQGVKFNPDKFQLKVKNTTFFGHMWTADGLKADPDKVSGAFMFVISETKEILQSFLVMVNFLNRYNPTMATAAAPLRDLLKKGTT